jgi:hypothetical protein
LSATWFNILLKQTLLILRQGSTQWWTIGWEYQETIVQH